MRFLISLLVFLPSILSAQNEGIRWMNFTEAMAKRQTEPKKIFIDMYTDWCGWCKKMDKSTFADPTVGKFANEKFYAVKLNAESKKVIKYQGREMTEQE